MRSRTYPSDLTDFEWDIIKEMIPRAKKGGRKRTIDVRQIINAIFYATDNGVKWRSLPKEYPHWETVYGYFKRWTDDQTIEKIHRKLRKINRVIAGKKPDETVSIIDSQTVRGTEEGYRRGFDAGKKNKGKKTASGRGHDGTRH